MLQAFLKYAGSSANTGHQRVNLLRTTINCCFILYLFACKRATITMKNYSIGNILEITPS